MRIKELLLKTPPEKVADYFIREMQWIRKDRMQIAHLYRQFQMEIMRIKPIDSGMVLLDIPFVCDGEMRVKGDIYLQKDLLAAEVPLVDIRDVDGLSDEEVAGYLEKAVCPDSYGTVLMKWDDALGVEVFLLDEKNACTLAAQVYWDMTFGGQTLEESDFWREDIFASLEKSETGEKYTANDVHELFGSDMKRMEEEESKYKAAYHREMLKNHILELNAILTYKKLFITENGG